MIIAAMATMPERMGTLARAIESLRQQVDALRVYLNNFTVKPSCLKDDEVAWSQEAGGDLGAEGKFFWFNRQDFDYYLTVDDDLLYPPDYVARLKSEFDQRKQRAVVGVHGFVFDQPIVSYITSRKEKYKCTRAVAGVHPVQVLGTATAIFNHRTIKLAATDLSRRNMADLQLAIAAQRLKVPMVIIPRHEGWIRELSDPSETPGIWSQTKAEGGYLKAKIAREAVANWQLWKQPGL